MDTDPDLSEQVRFENRVYVLNMLKRSQILTYFYQVFYTNELTR